MNTVVVAEVNVFRAIFIYSFSSSSFFLLWLYLHGENVVSDSVDWKMILCSRFILYDVADSLKMTKRMKSGGDGMNKRMKKEKTFRLINVAWNSFRSNRNCVPFVSSAWCCRRRHRCCCNRSLIGCFGLVCTEVIDAQDISLSGLSISESPSICCYSMLLCGLLPVAGCPLTHAQFHARVGEKIAISSYLHSSCIDCDGNGKKNDPYVME